MLVSLLSESTPVSVVSVLQDTLATLKPQEVTLEAFNSQYLQLYLASPSAILACAKVSRILGASAAEAESLLFTAITDAVELVVEVGVMFLLRRFFCSCIHLCYVSGRSTHLVISPTPQVPPSRGVPDSM